MKRSLSYTFALALLFLMSAVTTNNAVLAQKATSPTGNAKPADVDKIIR